MKEDIDILRAMKQELWWFMTQSERSTWTSFWNMVNTKKYDLSKKNLHTLSTIISNIQHRRSTVNKATIGIPGNNLFE